MKLYSQPSEEPTVKYSLGCITTLFYLIDTIFCRPASISWSGGKAFISGAGGLRLKSVAGQIGHNVVNGSSPL